MTDSTRAPRGNLHAYARDVFTHGGAQHAVYRRGEGPAVLVITELPGITREVVGFADRLVTLGFTAVLPDVFDNAESPTLRRGPTRLYHTAMFARACVRREFTTFALGKSSPVVTWLRALAAHEHAAAGGPGVGVVAMCFTGGFALAMAVDPVVLAPVLSQPSLPLPLHARARASIDCAAKDLAAVRQRCEHEDLKVLGLRFRGDPYVPDERFQLLRDQLGDGFVAVELAQRDGHPHGPLPHRHCVLTYDLIDAPGQPTRAALDQVLAHLSERLHPVQATRALP